ncbi:hypothetical protein MKW92_011005 [Papaver armeniacum]|nr:hypothetical protein MKW92_011005 [Papaver armeniacum]
MPPLLHFNLREPVTVGNKWVRDIQFRLVHCPLGQSNQDSDEIEKSKKITVGGDNERLKYFVNEVSAQWMSLITAPSWFQKIDKEYEFYGVLPCMKSTGFALTLFSLIVLVETPFVVVPLRAIEIVHLALLTPGVIDTTVMFQDLHNVLEINSIPINSLSGIKCRLNRGHVKYYVNARKTDRMTLVEHTADIPSNFVENELEDSLTFAYYKETDFDLERAALDG